MPRKALDQEMQALHSLMMRAATVVEEALTAALATLETGAQADLYSPVRALSEISNLCAAIEKKALRLLILQQPLGGRDLRYLTTALPIAGKLEQIGEEAMDVARIILQMPPFSVYAPSSLAEGEGSRRELLDGSLSPSVQITEEVVLRALLDLGRQALHMLQEAMRAFDRNESRAAREVEEEWQFVGLRYERVIQDLMGLLVTASLTPSTLQSGPFLLQNATRLFWLAQLFKQCADHARRISRRVVYIVEGELRVQ